MQAAPPGLPLMSGVRGNVGNRLDAGYVRYGVYTGRFKLFNMCEYTVRVLPRTATFKNKLDLLVERFCIGHNTVVGCGGVPYCAPAEDADM